MSKRDDLAVERSHDTQDRIGHGTISADLLLRVAPSVTIIPLKVFGSRLETSAPILACAIEEAAEHGVQVLNISISTLRSDAVERLYVACERAVRHGVVIVAAAFGRMNLEGRPAAFAPVIGVGVGGSSLPMQLAYRTNEAIECVASVPGPVARGLGGCLRTVTLATSAATPTVAGIVALLRERYPDATLHEVRMHLARLAALSTEGEASERSGG